ncbi:hypothetical protein [Sporosarcina sp. HYO08]|uniref:hypothetical protein n=1 Tax=Sporosarcina sp. HYO08 TaxID=1759557 RepID=UPI00079235E5|nr:hypothetical protein [Sporosarcina sp. HYO08]KXH78579.1 hypothetical protein AU377_12935 [Sporosarcina sp. HYO08]
MEEKYYHGDRELICINVDQVYDWIVKEKSFDITLTETIGFTGLPADAQLAGATYQCEVTPADDFPVVILSREDRTLSINGRTVVLQQLHIQKNFVVTLSVTLANGVTYTSSEEIPVTRCEQVVLCAPEGTSVEVTYTSLECFICSVGTATLVTGGGAIDFTGLAISVTTCQSIQSTYPVTVEFHANYCEPREDLPTACPSPGRPEQCPHVFPDFGHCR